MGVFLGPLRFQSIVLTVGVLPLFDLGLREKLHVRFGYYLELNRVWTRIMTDFGTRNVLYVRLTLVPGRSIRSTRGSLGNVSRARSTEIPQVSAISAMV